MSAFVAREIAEYAAAKARTQEYVPASEKVAWAHGYMCGFVETVVGIATEDLDATTVDEMSTEEIDKLVETLVRRRVRVLLRRQAEFDELERMEGGPSADED